MHVIKSVGVLSCAKIMGAIQAAIGLIFMPFFLLAGLVGALANPGTERVSSVVFAVFAVFLPLFCGVFGFLMGALAAWVYNLISEWMGGIQLEFQAPSAAVSTASVATD